MLRKSLRKYVLCMGLTLSMAFTQPAAVLAASVGDDAEIQQEGDAGQEIEDVENTDDSSTSEDLTDSGDENSVPSDVTETEKEEDVQEEAGDAMTFALDADDEVNQKDEHGCFTVPTAAMPEDLQDGIYELPFRLFILPINVSASDRYETTEPYGNYAYAQPSMGNQTFSTWTFDTEMNYATVEVKDGLVRVSTTWPEGVGCYSFNWYENKETMEAKEKKGGTPREPADDTEYEYEADYYTYGLTVDAITKFTFTPPSDNPVVYISLKAAGMQNSEQQAYLGFYWNNLTLIKSAAVNPETITVSGSQKSVTGTVQKLEASVLPENAEQSVKWTSSDTDLAVVDEQGNVTSLKEGTVTITAASTVDETIVGTVELTISDPEQEEPEPEEPEITDELVKSFQTLKDYVNQMDPNQYYINSSVFIDILSGDMSLKKFNTVFLNLRNWISDSEVLIQENNNTIPEAERETFGKELLEWDTKLADPEYFGEIYSISNSESNIVRGRTYEIPLKFYNAKTQAVITPSGNETEISVLGEENEYLRNLGADTATVTIARKSNGVQTVTIKYNVTSSNGSDKIAITGTNLSKGTNFTASTGKKNSTITAETTYKTFFANFTLTQDGTAASQLIGITLDWDNAKDVTEGDVDVDKSILQMYVSGITQRIKGSAPLSYPSAWPVYVSEEIKESGLLERAQKALQDENATQTQINALEDEIVNAFNSHKTVEEEVKLFSSKAAKKKAADYTADSFSNYSKYANMARKAYENYVYWCYATPGGTVEKDPELTWDEEERILAAYTNPKTNEKWSTDLADGDTIAIEIFSMGLSGGFMPAILNEVYTRYFELEDALVSIKDLNAAIAEAEKYNANKSDYTEGSYEDLETQLAAAKKTAGTTDADADQVAKAQSDLKAAVKSLVSVKDLKASIAAAREYKEKESKYTAYTFKKFTSALEEAEKTAADKNAAQDVINAVQKNLEAAVKALAARADKAQLKAAIEEAKLEAAKTDIYTEASLKIYNAAIETAEEVYSQDSISQVQVDQAVTNLKEAQSVLEKISTDDLDKNNLADGTYTVVVNLWHAEQDKESMGNAALYHNAILTVDGEKYTLTLKGHTMTVGAITGELDSIEVIPDGSKPKSDAGNYQALVNTGKGGEYVFDMQLGNVGELSDYYYSRIKVKEGTPMGTNWIASRLRISWDTLSILDVEAYPAFSETDSATGITVKAPEGALPAGTKLRITPVTDTDRTKELDAALSSLADKYTAYDIALCLEKDGKEESVDPKDNMELTMTLPVPDGYITTRLACYYIDSGNYANAVDGSLNSKTYTVVNNKPGTYAIAQKKTVGGNGTVVSGTTKKTTTTGTTAKTTGTTTKKTTTSAAKTGDETNTAMRLFIFMMAASAAAGLAVLRRKKV